MRATQLLRLLSEVFKSTYYDRHYGAMPYISCKFTLNFPSLESVQCHTGEMDHLLRSYYEDIKGEFDRNELDHLWQWVQEDLYDQKAFYEDTATVFNDIAGVAQLAVLGRSGGQLCLYRWNDRALNDFYEEYSQYWRSGKPADMYEARNLIQDLQWHKSEILTLHKYATDVFYKINVQQEADEALAFIVAQLVQDRRASYSPSDRRTHPKAVA